MTSNEKGMSLVEMLVVIGIMVVLAGILLPAINTARQSAFKMQCASRLKELAFIVNAYSVDYKGYYPFLDNNAPENATNGFRAKLGPYMGTKMDDVFKCTRPASDQPTDSFFYYYDKFNVDYPTTPVNLYYKDMPGKTPRGDTGTAAVPVFMCRSTASHYPHRHGVNVVYADGHVAWERKDW
jgi:prepilin-type processing-associated H-X9-DG protein/prepilin-type N-terminal cleavage/methylation domain-containing protein